MIQLTSWLLLLLGLPPLFASRKREHPTLGQKSLFHMTCVFLQANQYIATLVPTSDFCYFGVRKILGA